jgi:hypothetical protein
MDKVVKLVTMSVIYYCPNLIELIWVRVLAIVNLYLTTDMKCSVARLMWNVALFPIQLCLDITNCFDTLGLAVIILTIYFMV